MAAKGVDMQRPLLIASLSFALATAAVVVPVVTGGGPAQGQLLRGHDSNAPVDFSADRIEVQDRADRVVVSGNVHVTQGELVLDAARMTVAYRNGGTGTGTGGIQIQRLDASAGWKSVSIAKSYDKRAVLTDISLSVGKGEVLGLLGPNGAGKTTCFYSIMGLVRPDSGRILLDGVDITNLPMYRRARAGPWLSAAGNLDLPRHDGGAEHRMRVLELAEPDEAARAPGTGTLLDEFGLTRLRDSARRWRCRAVNAAAAKSRARWPPILDHAARRTVRRHRPAVHRRHPRSGERPQARAASACSSPITTCAKRSTSSIAPASSMAGRCCSPAARKSWSPMRTCAASIWARASPRCNWPGARAIMASGPASICGKASRW
jgi:energy-coupling factor transporter ATP-binding protein EcfA2